MKKVMMVGKIGCGKTTLSQRLLGERVQYAKTQAIQVMGEDILDTPGEYVEQKQFYSALTVTAVEADVILLLMSAVDEQNAFSPRMRNLFYDKQVIGVVTKTDLCDRPEMIASAKEILELAGVDEIVEVGFDGDEGLSRLRLRLEKDVL